MKRLEISEIFLSFQGEGPLIGRRAIFLRLARCNLRCVWCDTKYAYEPKYVLDVENVVKIVYKYGNKLKIRKPLLVITGGEPLLQHDSLKCLLCRIYDRFLIQIETNGTIDPSSIIDLVHYVVVSPKLSNSGNPLEVRRLCETYKFLLKKFPDKIYFKFVIDKYDDIFEVENIVNSFDIPRENVFLMPQCRSSSEHMEKLNLVQKLASEYDYNVSPRLQYVLRIR
ncbi:MAG: 7-carboxy-7-deazaguanine synthase QueE [Crenarchaeota archaeon]|nr:7-carboxy-7-deazaguanine synthase QueE [Thermoproteota archaeon]